MASHVRKSISSGADAHRHFNTRIPPRACTDSGEDRNLGSPLRGGRYLPIPFHRRVEVVVISDSDPSLSGALVLLRRQHQMFIWRHTWANWQVGICFSTAPPQ